MHIRFGMLMNGHVQIWMLLFNTLMNIRYLKDHIMLCNIPLFLLLLLILLVVLHVAQKFEKILKPMLITESTKECMNILLLINVVFQLWQNVLLEWDRCNILDGSRSVPTCLPKLIHKSAFGYLANIKETQFEKLAQGLFVKMITLKEHPTKGGRPN